MKEKKRVSCADDRKTAGLSTISKKERENLKDTTGLSRKRGGVLARK